MHGEAQRPAADGREPGKRAIELSPRELYDRLRGAAGWQVLDVRAPQRLAVGRVEPVPRDRFRNVRGSEVLAMERPAPEAGLDPERPVAVVCGRGNDSLHVARFLRRRGLDAVSLRGGIAAWMRMVVPRPLPAPTGLDALLQFDRVGKGALGYLAVSDGEALAVDVPRDHRPWSEAAREAGAAITLVADTHVHADYISGGPALADEWGVSWRLHPADAVYPYDGTPGRIAFQPLADGDRLSLGDAEVEVIHTPGHTEGSVSLRLPGNVVLTGDFLFVDSVGRPDLAGRTEAWSRELWRSLQLVRREWPEDAVVLPAHYADEEERTAGGWVGARLAALPERNRAFALGDEDRFLAWIRENVSEPPEAYAAIKAINVGLREATPEEADVLEAGRNECAIG